MIRLRSVNHSFSGRQVLKDITFEVKARQVAAVLGPSGSGKTTLLRIIAGTLKPDSGAVEVGSDRIGYIFQDHRLLPWRTAQDNIALVLKSMGREPQEARKEARAWMDRLGLRGFYDHYPRQLSGGMMQRVSIARAFAIGPDILLMDEPFSSLDTEMSDALLSDLRQVLIERRVTAIYVTHDLTEALSLADRLFYMTPAGLEEADVRDREKILRDYYAGRLKFISRT